MYYKLYKILNTRETLLANPEMAMLRMQVGEAKFKEIANNIFEEGARPFEKNFEYLRTGYKLS